MFCAPLQLSCCVVDNVQPVISHHHGRGMDSNSSQHVQSSTTSTPSSSTSQPRWIQPGVDGNMPPEMRIAQSPTGVMQRHPGMNNGTYMPQCYPVFTHHPQQQFAGTGIPGEQPPQFIGYSHASYPPSAQHGPTRPLQPHAPPPQPGNYQTPQVS